MIQRRHLNQAHEQQLGFCQSVRAGDLVYLSGVVSWNEKFEVLHPGDMLRQIEQIYSTVARALQQFDLSFVNVVKETGFTTNMDQALSALSARAGYYSVEHLPAATWVQVSQLAHPDLLLEIELIAAIK